MTDFIELLLLGVLVGSIYSLIATGFVLIFRSSGVLNFAQGHYVMLGAILVWAFLAQAHMPLWAALIAALIASALVGMATERLVIRPLIGQPLFSIVVMTLGLSIVLEAICIFAWGSEGRGYPEKFLPTGTFVLGEIELPQLQVFSLLIIIAVFAILLLYLRRSKSGLAMQAIADDQQVAQSLGVNVKSILRLTWMIAAVVAMVGGYILGNLVGIEVTNMPQFGFKAICVLLFGGLNSLGGIMLAGPIVGVLEYMASGYLDPLVGGGLKDMFPYIILLIVLVFRPHGLMGWEVIERV